MRGGEAHPGFFYYLVLAWPKENQDGVYQRHVHVHNARSGELHFHSNHKHAHYKSFYQDYLSRDHHDHQHHYHFDQSYNVHHQRHQTTNVFVNHHHHHHYWSMPSDPSADQLKQAEQKAETVAASFDRVPTPIPSQSSKTTTMKRPTCLTDSTMVGARERGSDNDTDEQNWPNIKIQRNSQGI